MPALLPACRLLDTGSFRLHVEVDGEELDSGPLVLTVVPPAYGDLVGGRRCCTACMHHQGVL